MFTIVPYVVAFFAPLQAASVPRAPSVAMIQQAAAAAQLAIPNAFAPEIVVPAESRTQLAPEFGNWWLGGKVTPVPEAAVSATTPPADSLFVAVRLRLRDKSLAPAAAASLLVESAVANERVGHHNLAREDLDLAVERDPTHADARRLRANRRHAAGDYHGALRDADAELAARPTDPAARYARACLLVYCERDAQAHREFTALLRDDPSRPDCYASRAAAAHNLGLAQDAELDAEIAVELAPDVPAYRLMRMKTCLAQGDYAGAYDQYRAGSRGDPLATAGPAELRVQVELMALAHSHFEPASAQAGQLMAQLDWMVRACPEFNPPRHLLAAEFLRAGRPDLAEQVATEALDRDPIDARAFHLRGLARAALARPDAALDFATALGLDDLAETRAELLTLYRAAGRHAEARALAEAGVEAHPDCGACRQFLATDDLRRGDFSAAERHATCALWLARDPAAEASARLTRAVARLAQGDPAAGDDFGALADSRRAAGVSPLFSAWNGE